MLTLIQTGDVKDSQLKYRISEEHMRNSRHTREFKESAIQLVLNSHEEIKTIAQDLGMNAKTLYNWVYNYKRDNNLQTCNRKSSKSKVKESTEEELRRLRRDNRILKQERDILKKAAAYFAKETL